MAAGRAQVVVVSNQSFPPVLPTNDGHCVIVLRVEDGALSELVSVFTDFFAKLCQPGWGIPSWKPDPGGVSLSFGAQGYL